MGQCWFPWHPKTMEDNWKSAKKKGAFKGCKSILAFRALCTNYSKLEKERIVCDRHKVNGRVTSISRFSDNDKPIHHQRDGYTMDIHPNNQSNHTNQSLMQTKITEEDINCNNEDDKEYLGGQIDAMECHFSWRQPKSSDHLPSTSSMLSSS